LHHLSGATFGHYIAADPDDDRNPTFPRPPERTTAPRTSTAATRTLAQDARTHLGIELSPKKINHFLILRKYFLFNLNSKKIKIPEPPNSAGQKAPQSLRKLFTDFLKTILFARPKLSKF
jgi:hypothetical protein